MTWQVRRAGEADMAAVAEIIDAHIVGGWAHFGDRPIPVADWVAEWRAHHERYPWLVAEQDGVMGGLAYGKPFNSRAAYDWTAEVSIYLRPGLQGHGLGTLLYGRLIPTLDAQGYRCLVAGISTPNEASVRLHERFGFTYLGTLERVGYKMRAWRNVGSWQRLVGPMDESQPAPVRPVSEVWRG
ncbi:MAG: GNAT family N-acetyltransferase [Chloroflexota bacterium]